MATKRTKKPVAQRTKPVVSKRTKKPEAQGKKPVRVVRRPAAEDVFSAAGGMPLMPRGLALGDGGRARKVIKELTWGSFDRHVQDLAREANKRFRPEAVVGLVHGGVFVGGALASALKVEFFPVRVTQRSRDSGRAVQASEDMPRELEGRRVLIVDDVASSGDSIEFATRLARAVGASAIKSAALIARPGRFAPDFVAVTADDFFVFPWDYADVVDDVRFATAKKRPAS